MSSSGLMYAAIVAAWAVYLVPMWLRREDELNRARQTRRYTAAIKVLSHKEAFERRWAQSDEAANTAQLPIAAGQGPVPAPTQRDKDSTGPAKGKSPATVPGTSDRNTAAAATTTATTKSPAKAAARPARKGSVAAASGKLGPIVSAPINSAWTAQDEAEDQNEPETWTDETTSAHQQTPRQPFAPQTPAAPPAATAAAATGAGAGTATTKTQPQTARRTGLMVRRRRMVTLLFAVSTLGALISADLGTRYIWAMITPAALLSAYIVWLRRDERTRAAERARRTAARAAQARAEQARAAARRAQEQAEADREATKARAEAEAQAQEQAQAEALQRAQTARRRAAAARSRAQAYSSPKSATTQAPADRPQPRRAANE